MSCDGTQESARPLRRAVWDELDERPDGVSYLEDQPFDGLACEYAPSGSLRSETEFRNGLQTGVSREYDAQGHIRVEEHFLTGSRHGLARAWNEHGQLVREAVYEYSVLMREQTFDEHGTKTSDYQIDPSDSRLGVVETYRRAGSAASPSVDRHS